MIIPTKWESIACWLEKLDAPKKIIKAAISIDDTLDDLGLGYNTQPWEEIYNKLSKRDNIDIDTLYDLVISRNCCSACDDCDNFCTLCELGIGFTCTPRQKHADNYFKIVRTWVQDMKFDRERCK